MGGPSDENYRIERPTLLEKSLSHDVTDGIVGSHALNSEFRWALIGIVEDFKIFLIENLWHWKVEKMLSFFMRLPNLSKDKYVFLFL